jgi:hypothetical protein
MNPLDWLVLLGTILGIAAYGTWRTRHTDNLNTYLKGNQHDEVGHHRPLRHGHAGEHDHVSLAARPGRYRKRHRLHSKLFRPAARADRRVRRIPPDLPASSASTRPTNTSGKRFDQKTRLLGAGLFVLQRGHPSRHYDLRARDHPRDRPSAGGSTSRSSARASLAIVYTVTGGSAAVNLTQKWQMAVIFGGMITAFVMLLTKLPDRRARTSPASWANCTPSISRPTRSSATPCGPACSAASSCRSPISAPTRSQVQRYIGGAAPARGPSRADVQRRPENPDAVLHRDPRRAALRVLSASSPVRPCSSTKCSGSSRRAVRRAPRSARSRRNTPPSTPTNRRRSALGSPCTDRGDPAAEAAARAALTAAQKASARRAQRSPRHAPSRRSRREEDEGLRLRVHFLHPDAAPARRHRPACSP